MSDPVHDSITTVTAKVTPVVATGGLAMAPGPTADWLIFGLPLDKVALTVGLLYTLTQFTLLIYDRVKKYKESHKDGS